MGDREREREWNPRTPPGKAQRPNELAQPTGFAPHGGAPRRARGWQQETKAELSNARLPKSKIAAKHFQVAAAASSELCYKFMRRHKFCNVCFGYTTKHTHTLTHTLSMSLFLMQEEKQTQISKANKKPVTPYSLSTSSSFPPLARVGLRFRVRLGLGWFLASS